MPFVVRWPGVVAAGKRPSAIVGQVDFMATAAEIVGAELPESAAEDSVSLMPLLRGAQETPAKEAYVHHSINGNFAIREGKWKLELAAGSGGWAAPREVAAHAQGLPKIQLCDLEADPREKTNVQGEHPEVVEKLMALLKKYVEEGRSTPGARQKNDAQIDLWKIPVPGAATRAGETG